MALHTITSRIEPFTTVLPHTSTFVITAQIESSFVSEDDLVPIRCSVIPAIVREDTGACSEGAACVWTAVNETVGYTRAYRMM
ncbi:hypothetical protein TNCV_3434501 [Trichonephila clavipes]|nr:hypothetical protein TNCV_3434501 [Trichonephila clavipes]